MITPRTTRSGTDSLLGVPPFALAWNDLLLVRNFKFRLFQGMTRQRTPTSTALPGANCWKELRYRGRPLGPLSLRLQALAATSRGSALQRQVPIYGLTLSLARAGWRNNAAGLPSQSAAGQSPLLQSCPARHAKTRETGLCPGPTRTPRSMR